VNATGSVTARGNSLARSDGRRLIAGGRWRLRRIRDRGPARPDARSRPEDRIDRQQPWTAVENENLGEVGSAKPVRSTHIENPAAWREHVTGNAGRQQDPTTHYLGRTNWRRSGFDGTEVVGAGSRTEFAERIELTAGGSFKQLLEERSAGLFSWSRRGRRDVRARRPPPRPGLPGGRLRATHGRLRLESRQVVGDQSSDPPRCPRARRQPPPARSGVTPVRRPVSHQA
jgi:hypothetical protein